MPGENQLHSGEIIYKPKPRPGKKLETVTVLSIDGGGSRVIIPAVTLRYLEDYLRNYDNDDKLRISDYFDVIAGSGTGSIIAAMLTVPDDHQKIQSKRPYTMHKIAESLKEIFKTFKYIRLSFIIKYFGSSPKDDFKHIICKKLRNIQLDQTLSNVVIPAFNLKNGRPFLFSSSQPNEDHIKLSDAVLGSSAIPAYLDGVDLKYQGEDCTFIDGGLVSTNPTLFALQEAEKLVSKTEPDYKNYLILSLGTAKRQGLPDLTFSMTYWIMYRLWKDWRPRLWQYVYDTFNDATEIYMTQLLACDNDNPNPNYLRIQVHTKDDFVKPMPNSSESTFQKWINYAIVYIKTLKSFREEKPRVPDIISGSLGSLHKLESIGERTQKNFVGYINPYTGDLQRGAQTNREALEQFARLLSEERKIRLGQMNNNMEAHSQETNTKN